MRAKIHKSGNFIEVTGGSIQQIPFAYINPFEYKRRNYAEIPPSPCAVDALLGIFPDVEITYDTVEFIEQERNRLMLFNQVYEQVTNYFSYLQLYEFQKDFLHYALANYLYHENQIKLILADDPRLGKSPQSLAILDAISAIEKCIPPVLVLCPKALFLQWEKYVYTWTKSYVPLILEGSGNEKNEFLKERNLDGTVLITNWEALYGVEQLLKTHWYFWIADEAHKIRNPKAQITGLAGKIKSKHKILMSATFVERTAADWWALLNILDPKVFTSRWRFIGQFVMVDSSDIGIKLLGTKNPDLLKTYLKPYIVQRRSESVIDMPEFIDHLTYCDLSKTHRDFYDKVEASIILELESGDSLTIPNRISMITRLRQAAIHPGMLDPELWVKEGAETGKLFVIRELLDSQIPSDQQVIIYSNFVNGAKAAVWAVGDQGFYYTPEKEQQLSDFTNGHIRVMCSTIRRGGQGLNLFNADWVIYLDLPWSTTWMRQSKERIRIPNKKSPANVITLIAKDTIDDYVYNTVLTKLKNVSESEVISLVISGYLQQKVTKN
jgi:SNF2 family DNA or RNA helicase